jgi:hypothetical protein
MMYLMVERGSDQLTGGVVMIAYMEVMVLGITYLVTRVMTY